MKRSSDLTESNAFCNNRFIPQQPYHKCDQSNRVYTNLNIISDDSVGFLLGSYDASAGWALQAYWPSYCSFRISLNNMVPLNSVCAYNTQSFFYSLFYLYWVFMASILFKCTIDLIFLLHLFCRDLLYKPVVICKISFFLHSHYSSLAMPYSSKLIYHLPVQHVAICHVSGVSTKLCMSSGNHIVLCVGSPINIFQVSASSCITWS